MWMLTVRNVYIIVHHLDLISTRSLYLECCGVSPVSQGLKCALIITSLVDGLVSVVHSIGDSQFQALYVGNT
jgi:hypothetical protein